MTTGNADIDTIISDPAPLVLSSGLTVLVERLKTRQMMRLMKIVTRGAGGALSDLRMEAGEGAREFASKFLAAIVFSIPEAEDETLSFVRSMVTPSGLIVARGGISKAEEEINENLLSAVDDAFDNPDLEDLVLVLERIVTVEAPHLVSLGKRLALLLKVQQQAQAAKSPKTSSKATSKN